MSKNVSIKIYAIVLKHKTDLLDEMTNKLNNLNFDYEIFDAVYGKDLDEEYYKKNNISIDPCFRNPWTNTSLTTGEIGCSLSHYFCWKKALEEGIEYPIFVESDAIFESGFENIIKSVLHKEPSFDLLYLGRKSFKDDYNDVMTIDDTYKLVNPVFSYWCLGYMFSKEGLRKIVNSKFLQNIIAVDDFLPIMYLNLQNGYYKRNNYSDEKITALALEPQIVKPKPNTFLVSETEGQPFYRYKYPDNFYENTIQAVTVGTDPVDGYKRFVDSTVTYGFPYVCLGFGKPWCGNDMAKGAGGGHKVVLLKEYLQSFDDNDERLIVFSDCYDAVLSCSPDMIINKFREIQKNKNVDILFSAEALIWPDPSLKIQFPDQETPYKFLNSGGFIGSIKNIKKMIQTPIESYDDDQLYYQLEYLKSVKGGIDLKIKLDAKAEIFQTLSSHFDYITIDNSKSKVYNKLTDTTPMLVHGNGGPDSKTFVDKLCNYINLKHRDIYGYKDNHTVMKKLDNLNVSEYPKIMNCIILDSLNNIMNIINLSKQKYPLSNMYYHVINLTDIDIFEIVKLIGNSIDCNISNIQIVNNCSDLRSYFAEFFKEGKNKYDYIFLGNASHTLEDELWFKKAICSNLDVIAPMIKGKNNTNFSNFWGKVRHDGFYEQSWDYFNILNCESKGYWNVPYISGSMLIHKNKFEAISKAIANENIRSNEGTNFDMFFCRCLQLRGIFMYIANYSDYGYISD